MDTDEQTHAINIAAVKKIESEEVQLYWCMVTVDWMTEVASTLLDLLIDNYVKLCGHSTASAWLEKYKKKSVQKSKAVHTQLPDKATSSTVSNKETFENEDYIA